MQTNRREKKTSTRVIVFNKPYGVICQFSSSAERDTLADYISIPDVYPAGRLDADSEGLVVLTNDGGLQHRIAHPRHKQEKVYWVQVERVPEPSALQALAGGVELDGRRTRAARVRVMETLEDLWPREPPIRCRLSVPTAWLEIRLREGRNRQVRRMTAAVGHPTLRLIRYAVGPYNLAGLAAGKWRDVPDLVSPHRRNEIG